MNIEGLDKKDHDILSVIKDHARMSYSDIGEKVGLSRVAVRNRMEVMEKKVQLLMPQKSLLKKEIRMMRLLQLGLQL